LHTIESLKACGVDLYLDQQSIEPTTPAGKLMLQMCGAFAEFERSMLRARIQAGLRRAVANGRTLGRPLNDPDAIGRARGELAKGIGINRVAKLVGLSNGTVQRIKAGMEAS
jgi:DNA invertase Pin-like site-specific DNA recombinase